MIDYDQPRNVDRTSIIEYKIQYLIQLENNISNYTLLNVTISQKIIKINKFFNIFSTRIVNFAHSNR